MPKETISRLLAKVDKLLDRYVDNGQADPHLADHQAFLWDGTRAILKPVDRPVRISADILIGIESTKDEVYRNTRNFVAGRPANNVLLWGERGTGKSSLVKTLLTVFNGTPLRIVQVYKHDILTIQNMYELIAGHPTLRFILFIDDLSFEEGQTDYKELKTIMDGGLEQIPGNLLFYATSNRKHLIPTKFSDNDTDEIRPADTVEEKVSLVDRFGLRFGFYHFSQDTYLEIVASYAARYNLRMDRAVLEQRAIQWALAAGGRNGRIAEQFVRAILGESLQSR
ncbi:MAG TPA: ATP-binding protein [Nitrospirota bacterium]|nr:ATP-binding protein [Nitrospirota bacterium]